MIILVCYFEENLRFMLLHFTFHTAFWEFEGLEDMNNSEAAACRHHNGEPWIYIDRWAEARMFFFFERDKWLFELGWLSLISPNAIQGRHNIRSLAVLLLCGFEAMFVHRAWMIFNSAFQQIIHEWYHCPRRYRGKQFVIMFPVLY